MSGEEINPPHLHVIERARETEDIPKNRPNIKNTINIEVGIDIQGLVVDVIPQLALGRDVRVIRNAFVSLRR